MQATQTEVIERTVHIDAKPETVFAFLIDPDRISTWMGRSGTLDPRPGGLFRVDHNGFDIMRGEFIEVSPPSRLVFTWGWESLGDSTRPGASTVTITLAPDGDGTRLHLLHTGLSAMDAASHGEGWEMFLGRLATRIAGGTVEEQPPAPLSESEEYASRLNTALCQLREVIENMPEGSWKSLTSEQRAANALAQHTVDHIGVLDIAVAVARGEPTPAASTTTEALNAGNAERDRANAAITRDEVLAALRANGPAAVEKVKAFSSADLDASMPMAFAGGQPVPVRALLEGPLLANIIDHLEHVRAAAR